MQWRGWESDYKYGNLLVILSMLIFDYFFYPLFLTQLDSVFPACKCQNDVDNITQSKLIFFPAKIVFNIHPCNFPLNHANNNNTNLESIFALRYDIVLLYETPRNLLCRFVGDKETHVRTTSQDFDNSNFIGYSKGRSEITSYEMLLDLV